MQLLVQFLEVEVFGKSLLLEKEDILSKESRLNLVIGEAHLQLLLL